VRDQIEFGLVPGVALNPAPRSLEPVPAFMAARSM
jgi:hypothetical protein